jgi:hypothetical protein
MSDFLTALFSRIDAKGIAPLLFAGSTLLTVAHASRVDHFIFTICLLSLVILLIILLRQSFPKFSLRL